MEGFLIFALIVVLAIRWWVLSQRYAEIERRIERATRDRVDPEHVAGLVKRVWQLEETVAGLRRERAAVPPEAPAPEPAKPEMAPPPPKPVVPAPAFAQPQSPAPSPPVPSFLAPRPAAPERTRLTRSSAEWEALVGGNWLNKLGIFVLVIAIALFLGYSFTQLGPAGRSSIGLAVSAVLLVGGVILERRAPYVIFARGLIGGGWAGLYFTVYAMQAVEAAKVIHNPLLGGFLLLAVATGMVVHSLRYHVQAVTGLAYAVAFATLAITPVTALSVIALIPLAASLLIVAYRFEWAGMALFGLVATYATCASRGDNGAPLWTAQTVFAVYWLLFETYDLLRARRHSNHRAEQAMLPLNALGCGALSYAKWSAAAPADIYWLAAGAAAAYLASTILRAVLRPPASFPPETETVDHILGGGFEGPVTLAAACSAAAAILKLHGQAVNNVLLAEGELLFLAGFFFRQNYPRRLAGTLFAALGVKLLITDIPGVGTVEVAGRMLHDWTPSAALAGLLFYANRWVRKAGLSYGYAASALLALIMGFEIPLRYLGMSWLGLCVLLFCFGWRFRLFDFRVQGYLAGALAVCAITLHQAPAAEGNAIPLVHLWAPLALAAAVAYVAALCAPRSAPDRLRDGEREGLEFVAGAIATTAFAALLWRIVPAAYLGPAWMAMALTVLELGLRRWPPDFRWHAYLLAVLGAGRVLFLTVLPLHTIVQTAERVAIGSAALLAYLFAARMFAATPAQVSRRELRGAVNALSACGSLFVLLELWALLDPVFVAPAWAMFTLALLIAGRLAGFEGLRWQSYALAAITFFRALVIEFLDPRDFQGMAERIAVGALVTACLFIGQLVIPRPPRRALAEQGGRLFYSLLATALATALLFQEVSGSMLTVAWGIEGAALLISGFPLRDRTLRLSGIVLFLVCVGKLFLYDLRALETLYRILSFFVLGVILVGVSWLYTRFRDQIQRYL
jgi:uncharacterized membrane protein